MGSDCGLQMLVARSKSWVRRARRTRRATATAFFYPSTYEYLAHLIAHRRLPSLPPPSVSTSTSTARPLRHVVKASLPAPSALSMPRAHLLHANASRGASHASYASHSTHVVPLFLPWLAPRLCRHASRSTLLTPTTPTRPSQTQTPQSPSPARPRLRCYSTDSAAAPVHHRVRASVHTPPAPTPLRKRSTLLEARRSRTLKLEHGRLRAYVARQPGVTSRWLLAQGQYRSLRRRILNLNAWEASTLDLTDLRAHRLKQFVEAFAALDRSVHARIAPYVRPVTIKHNHRCVRFSSSLFKGFVKDDYDQLWQDWMRIDVDQRKRFFASLLVYLLDRKPGRALHFIQVLANDPDLAQLRTVPIADALGFLARLHVRGVYDPREGWDQDSKTSQRRFVSTFLHIYSLALAPHRVVLDQDALYCVATLMDASALKGFFDALMQNRTFLGFDTLLHYANKFAEAGESQYALRCLESIKAMSSPAGWKTVVVRERMLWTCALILRKGISGSLKYHETPAIVAALVELGVTIDLLLYNVVMHNAMEAGDYTTAFKVYNALESNGLKADKHTYSILLHGCTSKSNPAYFHTFAEHCAEVAERIQDPYLATDYLYYLSVRYHDSPEILCSLLYKNYLRFFSTTEIEPVAGYGTRSLQSAIHQHRVVTATATGTEDKIETMKPPPMALFLVLQTEIKATAAQSTQRTLSLYEGFKRTVLAEQHPTLTRLAQDPIVWNTFLYAFCRSQQYASASNVIKDMSSDSHRLPEPNAFSWNIFMQAFFKTDQVKPAERVFDIMRARGIDPDQYSHGILLRGYARAQLVNRIGVHLAEIDDDAETDPDLLHALAAVLDRKGLMQELDRVHEMKAAKARKAEEVEEQARREHQKWLFSLRSETPTSAAPRDVSGEEEVGIALGASEDFAAERRPTSAPSPPDVITKSLPPFSARNVFVPQSAAKVGEQHPKEEKRGAGGV